MARKAKAVEVVAPVVVDEVNQHGPVLVVAPPQAPKPEAPKVRRLLVCGSRAHWEFDLVSGFVMEALAKFPDAEWFISGGAKGADAISAYVLEKKLGKKVIRIEAQWDKLEGGAGFARNWQMIMKCDAVAALWDGASKGTKQTMDAAKRMGKPVFFWNIPAVPEPEDRKKKK
jgi:hypothetical protein